MFSTGIVIHYVREYSKNEIKTAKSIINTYASNNMLNPEVAAGPALDNLVDNLPIGTIICVELSGEKTKKANICFPMFSSHVSLPIKQGEIVWFYKDKVSVFDQTSQSGSPILSINNFWLSRKIGSKLSEDLNFSHIMRDSKVTDASADKENVIEGLSNKSVAEKKTNKKIIAEESKKINLPDYKLPTLYNKKYNYLSGLSEIEYSKAKEKEDVIPAAVPRWYSKPYELSLQGSNNSLINLTKTYNSEKEFENSGAIDLVAGRHSIESYNVVNEEEDFYIIKNKFVNNIADKEKRKIDELKINKKSAYPKIKNVNDDIELLKGQLIYFGEEFLDDKVSEGIASLDNDASRIYISEFDNIDNASFYDVSNVLNHSLVHFDTKADAVNVEKDYLVKKKTINIDNFSKESIKLSKDILPSIFMKSNNIRIVSRKNRSNNEKDLKEGSIRIVKESNDFYSSAHLSLENDGKILIDGSSIMIGNFEKESIRHHGPDFTGQPDLNAMHGNGFGVLLGYDENISEPLVLGNTLQSVLEEMLNINIQLVEEIKKLTDDLQKHTHVGIPGAGISGPPQLPVPYSDFSSSKQKDIKERYTNIQKNLKDILSRFAKTS